MINYNHILEEKNIQCHYMDSATTDTPVYLKINENTKTLRVDEIISEERWYQDDNVITQCGHKLFCDCVGIYVWTTKVWTIIKRLLDIKNKKLTIKLARNKVLLMLQKIRVKR